MFLDTELREQSSFEVQLKRKKTTMIVFAAAGANRVRNGIFRSVLTRKFGNLYKFFSKQGLDPVPSRLSRTETLHKNRKIWAFFIAQKPPSSYDES